MTESEFYAAVDLVGAQERLSDSQTRIVGMYCAENGYDCGADCWTVAEATLRELMDQGQIVTVATTGYRA